MEDVRTRDEADLYHRDFDRWAEVQARHLRDDRLDLLDKAHLIEEIEALGKSQLFALRSAYALIAMHLLKLLKQPEMASASWENTINRERGNVVDLLEDNPGLKTKRQEAFAKAYGKARSDAAFETKLDIRQFPIEPPFTLEQLEARTWWPEGFPRTGESGRGAGRRRTAQDAEVADWVEGSFAGVARPVAGPTRIRGTMRHGEDRGFPCTGGKNSRSREKRPDA